jgi:uncharacterized protein YcnI
MIRNRGLAAALAVGAVFVGVFGFAGPASAHVTISPSEAVQGEFGRFAFRVPNESDDASTVKLEVTLPEDAPVASVSTMPVAGWSVVVARRRLEQPVSVHGTEVTEAVSTITWTAARAGGIKPGEFLEFPVSMGPLPEVDQMVIKAVQTYSDGIVARWIEPPAPGGEEPEDPAMVLQLAKARSASPSVSPAAAPPTPSSSSSPSGLAVGLGTAGLVAGLAGLVLGGLAFARSRRSTG